MSLMKFDPATGAERPYPSHPEQYRKWHGQVAWLFNPFTGKARDARDIGSDIFGALIEEAREAQNIQPAGAVLEWSKTLLDGESVTFDAAMEAIEEMGDGWRMPTRMEMESLLDLSRHDPAIDIERFPDTKSSYYWTATPCAWNTSAFWVVHFYGGLVDFFHRSHGACVRAVRSVPAGQ